MDLTGLQNITIGLPLQIAIGVCAGTIAAHYWLRWIDKDIEELGNIRLGVMVVMFLLMAGGILIPFL